LTGRIHPLKSHPIKTLFQQTSSFARWLLNLFDPPPLKSLTFAQKVGRVILLSSTLVVGSVLVAMLGALGLFLVEKGRELGDMHKIVQGGAIVIAGVCVNALCVIVLFQIKKADHKLVPPRDETIAPK